VKPRTEELLNLLLYSCDLLLRPTFRNLTDSYESWAYRNGLDRQLAQLKKRDLLEQAYTGNQRKPDLARVLRLTEAGRLHALGGRDPEACWRQPWDGQWHLVVFDVPNAQTRVRNRLRQTLRSCGFGCLQESVWINPHPLDLSDTPLKDVKSLTLFTARPCAGESDAEIVAGAWNFSVINRLYQNHQKVLSARPRKSIRNEATARQFQGWAARERTAWLKAVSVDPLLPRSLLPPGYAGRRSWERRSGVLSRAAEQIREFKS